MVETRIPPNFAHTNNAYHFNFYVQVPAA